MDILKYAKMLLGKKFLTKGLRFKMGNIAENYETSGLWGTFLEWIVIMKQKELYNNLHEFLSKHLENITKCIWFLRADEEIFLYNYHAMNLAGEGIALNVEKDFDALERKVKFIFEQYNNEIFSYEIYSFPLYS